MNQAAIDAAAAAAAAAVAAGLNLPQGAAVAAPVANVPPPAVAGANAPAVVGANPPQALVPIFTLNPSNAVGANAFIDYNGPGGSELSKIYYKSIAPLPTLYDGSMKHLHFFMFQVETRAKTFGWNDAIFNIPVGPNETHSLFTNHGQISVANVCAHAATYIGQPTKNCQDANALKLFLDSSLTEELAMRVLTQRSRYTINGEQHGPAMYRLILAIVGTETAASLAVIHTKIHALPAKAAELKFNVTKFNEEVTILINDLFARGKQPSELEFILYSAYMSFDDDEFVKYIKDKRSMVFDNSIEAPDYTELMYLAEERFKLLVDSGEWKGQAATGKAPTIETPGIAKPTTDEHLVALTAAIQAAIAADPKKVVTKADAGGGKESRNSGEWKWKDVAPKSGESHFKSFKGKEYVFCANHKTTKWVLAEKHKDGCTLNANWKFPTKAAATTQEMQYQQALMGIMDDDGAYDMVEDENI